MAGILADRGQLCVVIVPLPPFGWSTVLLPVPVCRKFPIDCGAPQLIGNK